MHCCILWMLVIVGVTTLPWGDYTGHSHWDHVRWVPLSERPLSTTDVLLNVILFVPLGFLLMWAGSASRSVKRATAALVLAAILSILAEYFQVYCHNRIPSVTDICTNVLGAGLGVSLRWWV